MMGIHGFNSRLMARIVGGLLLAEAVALMLPVAIAAACGEASLVGLLMSVAVIVFFGVLLRNVAGRGAKYDLREREGFWFTSVVWFLVPMAGALPYITTGTLGALDAVFESFSGFTSTGSTVIAHPETLDRSLLVWRALTQWMGGMGLVLLIIAFARKIGEGSSILYVAEFSGTAQRRLHPHMASSVRRMWWVYVGETVVLVLLLQAMEGDWTEALCIGFSTVSTGGFMTSANGLSHMGAATQSVVAVFMLLSGVNLALIYNVVTLGWKRLRRSNEVMVYLSAFLVAVVFTALSLWSVGNALGESFHYAFFHIASTMSTCGFFIGQPDHWSFVAVAITFPLICVGACTGSTGGGIKIKRVMIVVRYIKNYFTRMVHPRAVFNVSVDGMVIPDAYNNKIFAFVFMYMAFVLGGAFVLMLSGVDISASLAMSAANMANLGPTPITGALGVSLSYAVLPPMAKISLMVLMVAGRIEIFALVAIFSKSYWRHR